MRLQFDHGPVGRNSGFSKPLEVIRADSPAEVEGALEALSQARRHGFWVAGFASYELGYALEPKLAGLMPQRRRLPLMCFGLFEGPKPEAPVAQDPGATLGQAQPLWDQARYAQAFERVHAAIGAGDIYQANLTFALSLPVSGGAEALYAALAARQPVGHGALVQVPGLPDILSRSPELFFRTDAAGQIETRPMKGTIARSPDASEDARRKAWLAQDEKNRAENLMIVDLLRNDISRVAQPGSVRVPELFSVESYATVHQMTSLVQAQLTPGVGLGEILRALFPCGSITGAPKIRAMQILAELEPAPREIYCGTIGWMAPDGRSDFNVAIRTLMLENGQATLNVGGGVVWDSTAPSEYEEALCKARFAQLNPVSA